ncbi:MAG: 16S rRNA (adenine(1518)-N(6)/adenine(1519)-N(6))-dimethyltransferase RsmA [Desulfonauticus sp.]|nr:16S rRNA (adenine(1518)-N(6)/adenine(1519)-N(6))-dimethyltransferase RsmA [Desulfonauticus sp.]
MPGLEKYPKKSLGQHFLVDKNICVKIVNSLDLQPKDVLLEIGPGQGALTRVIAESKLQWYIGLEKDRELIPFLKKEFLNFDFVNVDATNFCWSKLNQVQNLKLVGNLPYNVASLLLWDVLSSLSSYDVAVFMVQKEVAQRIVAAPGSKVYGALSVWLQSFSCPQLLFHVSPKVFFPEPKVWSSVLLFRPRADRAIVPKDKLSYVLKIFFQHRRKQIQKILKTYLNQKDKDLFTRLNIDPTFRPENLTVSDYWKLANYLFSWQ